MTNIAVGRIKEHKIFIHCCKCGWHLCFYLLLQMFLLSEWGSRKFDKYGAVLKRWWWHREMSLGNIGENKSAQKEIQIKYLGKSAFPMDKNIACTAQHSYQKIIYQISYFMNIRLYIIFNNLIDFFYFKTGFLLYFVPIFCAFPVAMNKFFWLPDVDEWQGIALVPGAQMRKPKNLVV